MQARREGFECLDFPIGIMADGSLDTFPLQSAVKLSLWK
jgi:hypothetical protein